MRVMRPKGFTAICIIGLVLSVLGFLGLATSAFWWVMTEQMGEMMNQLNPGINQQQAEVQSAMYTEISELQWRWAKVTIPLMVAHTILVGMLFVGSIKGLKMREGAGKLLAIAMIAGIVLELAWIYPTHRIQQESQEISMRGTEQMMSTTGNPAQARAMMNMTKQFQEIGVAIGYAITAGWLIAKLSYYGTGLWYVNRREFKQLFVAEDELEA